MAEQDNDRFTPLQVVCLIVAIPCALPFLIALARCWWLAAKWSVSNW